MQLPALLSALLLAGSALLEQADAAPQITTFAGTGAKGFSGDGGSAAGAQFNGVFGLTRGPDGALYICDCDNQRVRKVAPDGTISTVAGNGTRGYSGDGGPAVEAALNEPYEVRCDKAGNVFFVERLSAVVRRVDGKMVVRGHGAAGVFRRRRAGGEGADERAAQHRL